MLEYVSVSFTVEVEIGVVGEVDDGWRVRLGNKGKAEFVLFSPFIACCCLQGAGITHFSILCVIEELHCITVNPAFPNLVLESFRASVKMVRTIVNGQFIFNSVKGESSLGDAVCIPSGNFSCAWPVCEITHRIRIADDNVCKDSFPVRYCN